MSKFYEFLVEYAKFAFPPLDKHLSSSTTDDPHSMLICSKQSGKPSLRCEMMPLFRSFVILGDAPLKDGAEYHLLASFSPRIQFNSMSVA